MLTPGQLGCLRAIQAHVAQHGVAPLRRELQAALGGIPIAALVCLLLRLRDHGAIRLLRGKHRGIELLPPYDVAGPGGLTEVERAWCERHPEAVRRMIARLHGRPGARPPSHAGAAR